MWHTPQTSFAQSPPGLESNNIYFDRSGCRVVTRCSHNASSRFVVALWILQPGAITCGAGAANAPSEVGMGCGCKCTKPCIRWSLASDLWPMKRRQHFVTQVIRVLCGLPPAASLNACLGGHSSEHLGPFETCLNDMLKTCSDAPISESPLKALALSVLPLGCMLAMRMRPNTNPSAQSQGCLRLTPKGCPPPPPAVSCVTHVVLEAYAPTFVVIARIAKSGQECGRNAASDCLPRGDMGQTTSGMMSHTQAKCVNDATPIGMYIYLSVDPALVLNLVMETAALNGTTW